MRRVETYPPYVVGIDQGITHFDTRFHPTEMRLFGGTIEVVDIVPERPDPNMPRPILLTPGWSATPSVYKGPLRIVESRGIRALSLSHMRSGGEVNQSYRELTERITERLTREDVSATEQAERLAQMDKRWQQLKSLYTKATLRRALTILGMLEEKSIESVDILAHSQGGIDAAVAKYLCPEKIGNFVGIESGGLMGKDNTPSLMGRFARQVKLEFNGNNPLPHDENDVQLVAAISQLAQDGLSPEDGRQNVREYIKTNFNRAFQEVRAIALSPIDLLLQIARLEGSQVGVIYGKKDRVFPSKKLHRRGNITYDKVDLAGEYINVGTVDYFEEMDGHHSTFIADPRVTYKALEWLTQMANEQKAAIE